MNASRLCRAWLLTSLILACGCSEPATPPPDRPDAASTATDAALPDASAPDAASADAGTPDAAPRVIDCADCTLFAGGSVFDGEELKAHANLVIRGGKIEAVIDGPVEVKQAAVVDLAGKTIIPGLFDLHVHLSAEPGPYGYRTDEIRAEGHLKAMLREGVTSFLDLGTSARRIFEQRARIGSGRMHGPTLLAAGPMVTPTGGHPCTAGSPAGDACIFVDGPADVAKVSQLLLAGAPDVIKIIIDSGTQARPLPRLSTQSMSEVQRVAAAAGKLVVAHVGAAKDLEDALDSGIRVFAHMPYYDAISPALAARLAAEGATIIPTLAVDDLIYQVSLGKGLSDPELVEDVPKETLDSLVDPAALGTMTSASYQAWAQGLRDTSAANFRTCLAAGVRMAAGTDAGNPGTFHGAALHHELGLYVQNGMSPLEALRAATGNAVKALGLEDRGLLREGWAADLLIVEGDPTQNIAKARAIEGLYRNGKSFVRASLSVKSSTSLVRSPTRDVADGGVCLGPAECASGLSCDTWGAICHPSCRPLATSCATGSACLSSPSPSGGYCDPGDGCGLFAQACENQAACVWLGNGATMCWYAGKAGAGEPCDDGCRPGFQCDYRHNVCEQLCDPKDLVAHGCSDAAKSCLDQSAGAGLSVGACR